MRVLLVNGFAPSSATGRTRYTEFRDAVHAVLKDLERQDVTPIDIIETPRAELDAFLFEMHSEFSDPRCITNFDQLDFVFVAGDASASPWAPSLRKLALLTKMCMMTGKCFYGSGLGAAMLAFVCSTAGEPLRVLNNNGKGAPLENLQAEPPPPPRPLESVSSRLDEPAAVEQSDHGRTTDVLLDTRTGDYFTFDARANAWTPRGNTGLVRHSSDDAHDYGAKRNAARAGSKKPHDRAALSHTLYASKRGDTKCCGRLDAARHALLRGTGVREFLANCKSCWDLDERINATGANQYRVLIDSSRGPVLIEFGNCVGAHFALAREYPTTVTLLRNFVLAKHDGLRVHEHVDRSYVSAISGSARLKQRLQHAATKTPSLPSAAGTGTSEAAARAELPTGAATMASGRSSPKRCRPVSAGPFRSPTRHAGAAGTATASATAGAVRRTIQTSRSEYPSSSSSASVPSSRRPTDRRVAGGSVSAFEKHAIMPQHTTSDNQWDDRGNASAARPIRPHTARAALRSSSTPSADTPGNVELQPETGSPQAEDDDHDNHNDLHTSFVPAPCRPSTTIKAHRRIRVAQRNELEKPYCAIDKFNALHAAEKAQHQELYYSVVNDAPYMSQSDREQLETQRSKLKWVGGPFRTAVGKATTQKPTPEASIFARVPFDQRNAPFHIIQRRQLEPPSPPSPSRRHPATTAATTHGSEPKRTRPASAAAATARRPQR